MNKIKLLVNKKTKMTALAPQIKKPHSATRVPRVKSDDGVERGGLCCVLCFVYENAESGDPLDVNIMSLFE